MKINEDRFQAEKQRQIKSALIELINQPSDKEQRPCPDCHLAVGPEQSKISTEHCSFHCANAPMQMSSDPMRYPIEPGIVPLVYAFYTMRLMMPCWSCEGHLDQQGSLFKTPKLWFYSVNEFYAKLVAQCVSKLKGENKVTYHWTVTLLPFSQSLFTTTYSLEPLDVNPDMTNLNALQNDVRIIAENLRSELFDMARYYIARADK